ncbi:RICIN domain-containing protein [Kitasatospora azatica]|uniref:RICIN domain-containing protein n=1 Tax=Kitasatospora azatica TaxID=58347 RepID=UPI0005612277|nr:RICIN domain-containing protein [Kitasatospora azatica]
MSHRGPPRPAGQRALRRLSVVAALTTVVAGLAIPAFADPQPGQPAPGKASAPGSLQLTDAQAGPSQRAKAAAKRTGKPVTIDELTTETSQTVANPDGTFTVTRHARPARVKKNGKWTDVDATLSKNADGTLSPAATPSGVALSGGGTAPLAAFKDENGHRFSLTLPFALPAPTVSGDSADYPDVLPGVDLKATVTDQSPRQWIPRADGSLYNPASRRCLDDPHSSTVNGTQLELWDCNAGPNQEWSFAGLAIA